MTLASHLPALLRWLEALGLGSYAQAFEDNDISFDLLPEITVNQPPAPIVHSAFCTSAGLLLTTVNL
jgi:SAM domain (Sterile alpha motif)